MNFKNGRTTDSVFTGVVAGIVTTMRRYFTQPLLLVLFLAVLANLHGCGGSVSEAENTPREDDQIETEEPIPTPPSGPAVSGDELDQLPGFRFSGFELHAGVEVFGVLADDHQVDIDVAEEAADIRRCQRST